MERNYEVEFNEECGRFLVASKNIEVGEKILIAESNGVSLAHLSQQTCSRCYKHFQHPLNFVCSNCPTRYCSLRCQELRDRYHNFNVSVRDDCTLTECEIMGIIQKLKLIPKTLREVYGIVSDVKEIRIMMKWVFTMIIREQVVRILNINVTQRFDDHQYLVDCISLHPKERIAEIQKLYDQFCRSLMCSYTKTETKKKQSVVFTLFKKYFPSHDFFTSVYLKKVCNGFAVFEMDECILQGLFPGDISLLNHSCEPNLSRENIHPDIEEIPIEDEKEQILSVLKMEPKILITANRHIDKAQPLHLCYLGENEIADFCVEERNKLLSSIYCFNCSCGLCKSQKAGK